MATITPQTGSTATGSAEARARRKVAPPTDIYETETHVVLLADMPGVSADTLELTLDRHVLTLAGRAVGREYEGHTLAHAEYEPVDYERAFTLAEAIDENRIQATLANGVLRVVLEKSGPAAARKIRIATA